MNITPAVLVPLLARVRPRPADLLPPDQPPRPYPQLRPVRYNAGVRALLFTGFLVAMLGVLTVAVILPVAVTLTSRGLGQGEIAMVLAPWGNALAIPPVAGAYLLLTLWWEQRRPPFEWAPRRLGGLGVGLALGTLLCSACVGLLALFGAYRIVGVNPSYDPWLPLLTLGVSAAVVEEILFRGILFRLVEGTIGTWGATAVSGLAFGLAHLTNPGATLQGALAIVLEAGVLFAFLYALTRSLWVVMGLHFAWNVVQGPVFGIVVSGSSAEGSGWLQSTLTGPAWLAGGGFGMEASVVTIVVLTAVAGWLGLMVQRNGLAVAPFWVRRRRLRAASDRVPSDGAATAAQE